MKYQIIHPIDRENFLWDIPRNFRTGEIIYSYDGCNYGCVSSDGVAVTEKENIEPFFELPAKFLQVIENQ